MKTNVIGHGILKYDVNHFGFIVMKKGKIVEILKIEKDSFLIQQPTAIEPEYTAKVLKEAVEIIPKIKNHIN